MAYNVVNTVGISVEFYIQSQITSHSGEFYDLSFFSGKTLLALKTKTKSNTLSKMK